MNSRSILIRVCAAFLCLIAWLFTRAATSPAIATTWTAGTGSWHSSWNWTSGVPYLTTDTIISNGGTSQIGYHIVFGPAEAAKLRLGDFGGEGTSRLEIFDAGALTVSEVVIGYRTAGFASVSGSGSTWTLVNYFGSGTMSVGQGGQGELLINSGGIVSGIGGAVGDTSLGKVTISDAGSRWSNSSDLVVGNYGAGQMTVAAGGVVTNATGTIGNRLSSTGTVEVSGVGSKWTNSGALIVGGTGTGDLSLNYYRLEAGRFEDFVSYGLKSFAHDGVT